MSDRASPASWSPASATPGCATTASAARWPGGCAGIELPPDVAVMDAGTGGLDLAYEVMRGYDALVIVDVSRQGGEPGTLYVMEPDEASVEGGIEDGETINPHGMDPQTVLRFVKSIGAWPGQVVVVACEPARGRGARLRALRAGRGGRRAGRRPGRRDARRAARGGARGAAVGGARAVAEQRDRQHRRQARGRAPRDASSACASGGCARSCPTRSSSTSSSSRATRVCEGARLEQELVDARLRCNACGREWAIEIPAFRCPACGGTDVVVAAGDEFEVESIEVEEAACIAQR